MTIHHEHQDTPDASESAPGAVEAPDEQTDETGNGEAAKYRRRLREVETERDDLRSRLETYQTSEVERRISDSLETPSDVWLSGVQLADVLNENGEIDEAELDQTVLQVTTDHPGWRKRARPGVDPDQGQHTAYRQAPSWSGLLRDSGS